ncbi:MAG: hypothetical protein OEZ68_16675 [Gammaproteobacteria bacterium]|nr:hypothetical protein [Gammaproteobacteria bacterium]MDH5802438.1 hypothetical protein [Gammaproteobacteria bacterium]
MALEIPAKYQALVGLLIWGGVILFFNVIRLDTYGLDEGAAMALLWGWSISDQIVNPVTTYGGPDFRALLFLPLGLYWSGSILAAKVFTLIITFIAAIGLYRWSERCSDPETALIATGLFLIAPMTILLADSMSAAPFLLFLFSVGIWLDGKYRASAHSISSLYFIQLILVAITLTIHPMGLAYPLALAWHWHQDAKSEKQKKQVFVGLGITALIILAMQSGWVAIEWFANPLVALGQAVLGYSVLDLPATAPLSGILLALLLIFLLYKNYKQLSQNLMGTMLLCAIVLGLVSADRNWALMATVLALYLGFPLLLKLNKSLGKNNFAGQRGLVFIALMVVAVVFMQVNKAHSFDNQKGLLSPADELIKRLADEAADPDKPFVAASQWPAKTLIVCRRDVFKLPPQVESGQQLLNMTKGLTHVMFDHKTKNNESLIRNFTEITSETETLAVQSAGVIIKLKANYASLTQKAQQEKRASPDKVLKNKKKEQETPGNP